MNAKLYEYLTSTSMDACFVMDTGGKILEVNDAAVSMYGYTKEELLALSLHDIEAKESEEETWQHIEKVMTTGFDRFESCHYNKTGGTIAIEVSAAYVPETQRILSFCRDVTELKKSQATLNYVSQCFNQALNGTQHVLYRLNVKKGCYDYISPAFEQITGHPIAEFSMNGIESLKGYFHPDDVQRVFAAIDDATRTRTGNTFNLELAYRLRKSDGDYCWLHDSTTAYFDEHGELECFFGSAHDATEQKETEAKLLEAQELFSLFMRYTPVHTFIKQIEGNQSRFVMLSDNYSDIFGRPAEEFRGRTMEEVYPPDFARRLVDDDIAVVNAGNVIQVEEEFKGRSYLGIKFPIMRKDKDTLLAGFAIDITERKRAEEALKHSHELMRYVIEHTRSAIAVLNRDMRYLYVSQRFLDEYRVKERDVIGKHHYEIFPDLPQRWREVHLKALAGEVSSSDEDSYFREDGSVEWTRWECRPWYEADASIGGIILYTEVITDRKRAEEERLKLEQQFLHSQKLESLGILAGGIAHDFNNILTSIVGNTELARLQLPEDSPIMKNLKRIEKGAARAADLANQMLAYSGRGQFVIEPIDLNHLVEEMGRMLEVSISKGVSLRYHLSSKLPAIKVDATQIRQVLMNLVINASEAIGEADGVVAISTGSVRCESQYLKEIWRMEHLEAGHYVYLEVTDTGCGMNPEVVGKLFDPFFTTKFTGRGLGMSAVLGIVRGHHGAIKVKSDPGKGTTFQILLPASTNPVEVFVQGDDQTGWHGQGTVLLVDDEDAVRESGSDMLSSLGYTVVTATDGLEALACVKERQDIDLVILDVTMPKMDGMHCLRELRILKPQAKVVMSSGFNEEEITRKVGNEGFAGFIHKPYTLSDLKKILSKILYGQDRS